MKYGLASVCKEATVAYFEVLSKHV
jgi:hypothetical protein